MKPTVLVASSRHRRLHILHLIMLLGLVVAPGKAWAQRLRWEQVATRLPGGSVQSLSVDSTGRIYALTYNAGVFRSTDGGYRWYPPANRDSLLQAQAVHSFRDGNVLAQSFDGIFLSSDGGVTWDSVLPGGVVCAIGARMGVAYAFWSRGVFRSTDQGRMWSVLSDSLPLPRVHAALLHEGTSALVLAAGRSLFRSEDSGRSWRRTIDSLGPSSNSAAEAFLLTQRGSILASGYRIGCWRSTDGGSSWVATLGLDPAVRGWVIGAAAGGALIAIGDSGQVWRSVDDGVHWVSTGSSVDMRPNALLLVRDSVVLAGYTYYGVERSVDGGQSYVPSADGLYDRGDAPWLGLDAGNGLYAATRQCLYRMAGVGASWLRQQMPRPPRPVVPIACAPDGWIVAGAVQSRDDGRSWTVEESGLVSYGLTKSDFAYEPVSMKMFAATVSGIYARERADTEWGWPRLGGLVLNTVVAHPSGVLVAGGSYANSLLNGLLYRSTDGGNEWLDVVSGGITGFDWAERGDRVNDIAVDGNGALFATTSRGVFRSTDVGINWRRLAIGPDSLGPFLWIVSVPSGPTVAYTLAAGETGRFYSSSDSGDSWSYADSELPGLVGSLVVDSAGHLYAGVADALVYRTLGPISQVESGGHATVPLQATVTPNPAREAIRVALPSSGQRATATLGDVLGRVLLETPVTGSATIDVSGVPNGLYLLHVDIERRRVTHSVVIHR